MTATAAQLGVYTSVDWINYPISRDSMPIAKS